jgi:large subunit ribosomal protein L29
MKIKDIREFSADDLSGKVAETRKQILEMRFQLATHKLDSPAKLRSAKKTLARLLTIQSEKGKQ